ncbi:MULTISPECIES: ATP-binding protein [unclassified Rhizobium]|uniref:sensor histidine kinase n=1 Tax=unclassified Rhizobium TaxID=2613769 RepID=UPI001A999A2D|nr:MULTISPECIES: ATP-binding protein [unclassified Rhizobium]MBX5157945.1 ATPase [Rhizobium sp. NZLR8]MBX5172263.1 ATPase [Rhizobium sp. NZLR1b]MBX5193319.1 ATPase [Rhizobium sp. NZLR3b]MBX5195121.1 ATPase [Rhizobium sp. NZLR10]MBX5203168.1 ATPase [Rhizobium sp. NZLR1]
MRVNFSAAGAIKRLQILKVRLTSHITFVLVTLTCAAAVLLCGFAWLAAVKVDDLSLRRQADFVDQGLEEQIAALPREQESIAKWDDAFLYAKQRNHEWLLDNIGRWTSQYFGHDRTYIFDDTNRLMFAFRDGADAMPPRLGSDDGQEMTALAGEMRAVLAEQAAKPGTKPLGQLATVRTIMIGSRPAIASARPILPSSARMQVEAGQEFIAVSVKFIDEKAAESIAHYARLEGLHFASKSEDGRAEVPVSSRDGGTIGYLVWSPILPGFMLLQQIAPAGLGCLALLIAVVFWLGRGLHRTSLTLLDSQAEITHHRYHLEEMVADRTAEIERQREELDRLLVHERQVNALQRQFVAMASHEFRTPLAIIDAAAQRLCRSTTNVSGGYVHEKAGVIRSAVVRMVDLMESILASGRLETGQITLKRSEGDLKALLVACCDRQRHLSRSHVLHLDVESMPDLLTFDRSAMEQVFTNLISNAVKYSPNAPNIYVRARVEEKTVEIAIADSGIGMDSDDLPKLFQPYYRARSATGIAGTGIGLNVVKQVVELHGGTVEVTSELGKGTTFIILLPIEFLLSDQHVAA